MNIQQDKARQENCAWCWKQRHPGEPFPKQSSTICPNCKTAMYAQLEQWKATKENRMLSQPQSTTNQKALALPVVPEEVAS